MQGRANGAPFFMSMDRRHLGRQEQFPHVRPSGSSRGPHVRAPSDANPNDCSITRRLARMRLASSLIGTCRAVAVRVERAFRVAQSMRAEAVAEHGFDLQTEERIIDAMMSKLFARCIG